MMMPWLQAFFLTHLLEISSGLLLLRQFSVWKRAGCIAVASTITHPILWFVFFRYAQAYDWSYNTFLLVGEGYVWIVEGLWYQLCRFRRPFATSLLLNVISFTIGLLIQKYS